MAKMMEKKDTGNHGESLAVSMLEKKGYSILERNWRVNKLEIDIIAKKDNVIVIVEVKTRSTREYGDPGEMVSKKQRTCLLKAANSYIAEKDIYNEIRFDIISVFHFGDGAEINHIPDAFYPIINQFKI